MSYLTKDNVFMNIESRIIVLSADIDESCIGFITFEILHINQTDDEEEKIKKDFERKPIKLYINSYGGSVYDMWTLIDAISLSKTPIHTYCTGYAMSAGFQIFLAGHKRYCSKHATFLYHQMSCWRSGKYQDMVDDRLEMDYLQNQIEKYVAERTNISKNKLKDNRKKKYDWYIHANKALDLKIVDEII